MSIPVGHRPKCRAPGRRVRGSRSASTGVWFGSPRRAFQRLLPERPTQSGASKPTTPFESTVERKLRRRQLTEDGNVEISGRDLRLPRHLW